VARDKKTATKCNKGYIKKKKLAAIALIACFLSLLSYLICSPTIAEKSKPETKAIELAPVVLDGKPIFKVTSFANLSATQRADNISALLKEKLRDLQPGEQLSLRVVKQENETVIRIEDRHLVTVSDRDYIRGMSGAERAEIWREKIQSAINKGIKERSLYYRSQALKMSAIALLFASLLYAGLFWLGRRYRKKQLQNPDRNRVALQLLGIILLEISVWIVFIYYSANLFPETRTWLYQIVTALNLTFNSELINFGEEAISLNRLFFLILLGIVAWILIVWLSNFLKLRILPLTGIEPALQDSIALLTRYGLIFIGMLLIFNFAGIDFRSLATILSALAIGIGFGLQNIVKDLVSGLIIIFARPIKVGELVQVGDTQGLVLRIGIRTTEISHIDRYIILIPNSRFIEEAVQNWHRSELTRLKVYVDVSFECDRTLVLKALLAAAQGYHREILRHPPPKAQFRGFSENGLKFRIVVFIRNPLKQAKVRTHLYDRMEMYLSKYNIELSNPQREIKFKVPQIDRLVGNLAKIHQDPEPQLYYPGAIKSEDLQDGQTPQFEEPIIYDEYDFEAIVTAMRGDNGIEIKDRRYGFKIYRKTFLGSEAVEWLMEHERATRVEAIAIGQLMIEQQIVRHVLEEHIFKDEPLFYRFYLDEEDEDTLEMSAVPTN